MDRVHFLEYDFIVMYKPSRTHVVTNALSKPPNIIESTSAPNQATNPTFFYTKSKWLNDVKEILKIDQIKGILSG
jgi:hypothetical protein